MPKIASTSISLSANGLEAWVRGEYVAYLSRVLLAHAGELRAELQFEIGQIIRTEPEYQSLISGDLRVEFGLENAQAMVESVIQAIQASVEVKVLPASGEIYGGLQVGLFKASFEDALSAEGAKYTSYSKGTNATPWGNQFKSAGAKEIPWLKWLLLEGDRVIITGYEIMREYPNRGRVKFANSRTGEAIMIRRTYTGERGKYQRAVGRTATQSTWRVPAEFAGTATDNWITRTALSVQPRVEAFLLKVAQEL